MDRFGSLIRLATLSLPDAHLLADNQPHPEVADARFSIASTGGPARHCSLRKLKFYIGTGFLRDAHAAI